MRLLRLVFALIICLPLPAQAAVTITFWSHEFGSDFPHAFFTLHGTINANGVPVDANYGFTAKSISPALLLGSVPGRLDISTTRYIEASDAQFAMTLTDAQYADILQLVAAWDEKTGDSRYNLNRRNCVHFVKEAAAHLGLAGLDQPKLMKRPRSYLDAVEAANIGWITPINLAGKAYLQRQAAPSASPADVRSPSPAPRPNLLPGG